MSSLTSAAEPTSTAAAGESTTARQKTVTSVTAIDIKPRKVEWLLPGLIPFGAITVLAGQPGLGKSLLTVRIAADFSAKRLATSGAALMLSAEDPAAEVVVPRLAAARAKRSIVHFASRKVDGLSVPLRLPDDVDLVRELTLEHGARLVVIDPLAAHLGGRVDTWKDQSIRTALAPLAALAEERDLAVVVVAHLNKGLSSDPVQRLGGSVGLPAAARSVLLLGRDPDDPDGERGSQRVLAQAKSNYGSRRQSLAYRIIESPVEPALPYLYVAEIVETGTSAYEATDLLRERESNGLPPVMAGAVAFLHDVLADGPRKAADVKASAEEAALPWDAVKRAKVPAGVHTYKERGVVSGPWMWALTAAASEEEPPAA